VWESRKELEKLTRAILQEDVKEFYGSMFDRLKALRNQIFHGSALADSRRNQDALVPAVLILEELLPLVISVMIDEGRRVSWPAIPYLAGGTPLHPLGKCWEDLQMGWDNQLDLAQLKSEAGVD
jgi:hypothetical protein